jgi:ubiquinone biosynthesis protein Coq4
MDTSKVKTDFKQEAAAGLFQSDQRSTTASSEEDRLAAGIFMIGLQARKLSGVQWEKLIREDESAADKSSPQ